MEADECSLRQPRRRSPSGVGRVRCSRVSQPHARARAPARPWSGAANASCRSCNAGAITGARPLTAMTVEAPPKYASVSTHAHERLIWARMAARLTPDVSGMRAMPCHARTVPCQRTTGSSMGKSDGIIMASLSACAERRRAVQAIQVVEDDGCERFMACSDMLPAWRPVAAGSGARQRRQERAARSRTDAISSEGADSPLRQQRDRC